MLFAKAHELFIGSQCEAELKHLLHTRAALQQVSFPHT